MCFLSTTFSNDPTQPLIFFFYFFKKIYDKAKKKISQQGRDISTVLRNSSPMII